MEQELSKKLAEWAEWHWEIGILESGERYPILLAPNEELVKDFRGYIPDHTPNFPQSLDACFKWLVPKAIDKIMAEQGCSSDVAYAILFKRWLQELELIIPDVALALCLAIGKRIVT